MAIERSTMHGRHATRSVVIGLGATGLSCARYLAAHGQDVVVMDSRSAPPALAALEQELPGVQVHAGAFDAALLDDADQLVVSPGVSLDEPVVRAARERGLEVLGDVELFARAAPAPVIAVTGSNGKSTVTTMVAAMLEGGGSRVLAGGNLGEPALDLLGRAEREGAPDFFVLELSSFQLERTHSLRARAAVVLNVSADHMDRHGGLREYAAAKAVIYRGCATAVVNRDDPAAAALASDCERRIEFGLQAPGAGGFGVLAADGDEWLSYGKERLTRSGALRVSGRHNVANALAALALVHAAGRPLAPAAAALREYRGLPHRTQLVVRAGGVTWIDDSKATNVGAAVAAVRGFTAPLVLIAGGRGKGADFAPLADALRGHVRVCVLLGEDAPRLASALAEVCPVVRAADMDRAVELAAAAAVAGDIVLLSPACASQDMFTDFAARGEAFSRAVRRRSR